MAERTETTPTVSLRALLEGTEGPIEGESDATFQHYCNEIAQSGFPGFRSYSGSALTEALAGYLERIFDTDLPELGVKLKKPATMRAWMRAYAAATGTLANWETIRDAANTGSIEAPSKPAVLPFRDALTRLRILDELPAWLPTHNELSRVSQAPKHYLADPALALALLGYDGSWLVDSGLESPADSNRPLLGRLFEALALLSIRVYAQTIFAQTFHFRQFDGRHEIDAMVQGRNGKLLAIEIKLGATVESKDLKHLKWLKEELGPQIVDTVLIYSGPAAFRYEGVAVVPLDLLGP
jgi:predicted AAA+ superfamily ATPase